MARRDYEAGLEYCDAVTLKGKKLMNQMTHYLVQWSDGAADSWEPMPNLSDALIREYEAKHRGKSDGAATAEPAMAAN